MLVPSFIRRVFQAAIATLLLLYFWGTSPPSSVAQVVSPDEAALEQENPPSTDDAAVREDLAAVAAEEGISIEQATATYAWHQPFAQLVDQIRSAFPESYADSRINGDRAWIGFAALPPAAAMDWINAFERPVEIRTNLEYTEAELDNRLVTSHYAVFNDRSIVADASSGYDIETGNITIDVELAEGVTDEEEALDQLSGHLSTDSRMPITLRLVQDVQSSDHTVRGGASLTTCTSGFAVRRYIGHTLVYGLSTAGHCGNGQDYHGRDVLNFAAEHEGDWGDAQWHTSSEQVLDDFWQGSEVRDVADVGHAVVGQMLCRYGKTTGRRCDDVYSRNHCNGSRCRLSIMDTNEAQGGDSGGPWYWANTAYGLHQGEIFYWGAKDAFTPVTHLDEALGLEVATSPGPAPK